MKTFKLPKWKSGHCLPHCITASALYFKPDLGNVASNWLKTANINHQQWLWPASGALFLLENGLNVTTYNNDLDFFSFASHGLYSIKEKYGQIGIDYFEDHFDLHKAVCDTQKVISHRSFLQIMHVINETELKKIASEKNIVLILNVDHLSLFKCGASGGHYVLISGISKNNEELYVIDPIYPDSVFHFKINDIRNSQIALNDEVISLAISII